VTASEGNPSINQYHQRSHGTASGYGWLCSSLSDFGFCALSTVFRPPARLLATAAGVILFSQPLPALDRDDLLFHASFDAGVKADYAQGSAEPKPHDEWQVAEGIKGQGVVALKPIVWDGKANVMGEEGTFSFWFSPVDWASGDGKSHGFAILSTANGTVRLYKYYPGNLGMLMQAGTITRACWNTRVTLRQGQFHQLTFTWHPNEWTLYVDGLRVQRETDSVLPFGVVAGFSLGGSNTVFDELLILRRSVTEEEARILYYRVARNR